MDNVLKRKRSARYKHRKKLSKGYANIQKQLDKDWTNFVFHEAAYKDDLQDVSDESGEVSEGERDSVAMESDTDDERIHNSSSEGAVAAAAGNVMDSRRDSENENDIHCQQEASGDEQVEGDGDDEGEWEDVPEPVEDVDELDEEEEPILVMQGEEEDGGAGINLQEEEDELITLRKVRAKVGRWLNRNIGRTLSRQVGNGILRIIREDCGITRLPRDVRAFLKTKGAKKFKITKHVGGEYAHIGLERGLRHLLRGFKSDEIEGGVVKFWLYIDGVTKYINCRLPGEFWPILCRVDNVPELKKDLATVGVFYGSVKPSVEILCRKVIDEYLLLTAEGLDLAKKEVPADKKKSKDNLAEETAKHDDNKEEEDRIGVILTCVVADAPGRQLCKGIISHNSKHGCERCNIQASSQFNRTIFPVKDKDGKFIEMVGRPRTNISFRNEEEKGHYKVIKPDNVNVKSVFLEDTEFDMIKGFPIDPMHLCGLGVSKRLLQYLIQSLQVKESPPRLVIERKLLKRMSQMHADYYKYTPMEQGRKAREIMPAFWKAVEHFLAMCYTLLPLFYSARTHTPPPKRERDRTELDEELYQLIVLLTVIMRIICDPEFSRNDDVLNQAEKCTRNFVRLATDICGEPFVVYNVHSFLHIVDDVRHQKRPLIDFSAFIAENYFRHLMMGIRSPHMPLKQLLNFIACQMVADVDEFPDGAKSRKSDPAFDLRRTNGNGEYSVCKTPMYTIDCLREADRYVDAVVNGAEVPVRCLRFIGGEPVEVDVVLQEVLKEEMFDKPVPASLLSIRMIKNDRGREMRIPAKMLRRKLFRLPIVDLKGDKKFVVLPLLHTKDVSTVE